ncbi:hypothetical protein VSVS12_04011 [Vibrio scophthalmi]|uniref:hypothetical protein n=1 Tax=Vibrio scophthalmi TaxID=45658 RepID=UPI0008098E93|nr:hypothetical protein [Vibrio scophthalmi]ANS87711.1 hypothetical protein VSVS12_04011 [Vibrio scophthalmi]
MSSCNISGAELARSIMSTVGVGHMLVGAFISAADGLDKLNETRLFQNIEKWPILTSDSSYSVAKETGQSQTQVDGEALFGFITFDASSCMSILDSKGCLGITDSGTHEMSVNFEKPMGEYIYSFFASEAIAIVSATQKSNSLSFTFNKPYTGIIKIVFFEKFLGLEVD